MAKTRLVLNRKAFRQIARSDEVLSELAGRAERVADTARADAPDGQDVEVSPYLGRNRARVSIMAPSGLQSNAEDGWLGKSIDSAR